MPEIANPPPPPLSQDGRRRDSAALSPNHPRILLLLTPSCENARYSTLQFLFLEGARSVCTSQTLLHSESPGGGKEWKKGKLYYIASRVRKKKRLPLPPSLFPPTWGKYSLHVAKKEIENAQQQHSVFSPLYQESAVCYTTSWREGKRKRKKCSGADKWKEKWEGERLIWKMEMAPDEIWEKGSVGGRKVLHFHRCRTCKIEGGGGRIKQQRERSEAMPPTLPFSPLSGPTRARSCPRI